ncbi:hypothetical protein BU25DRAFT_48990 [Macroventuria anomochaeta]|uniref:Uncharacterized protein n=1 Tax=Macroventuria anomochaeta TaxID=301207 RepID=A0ACB6S2Z2_9PLEO|nr:uncharacterized protein BU25DRAFT_48990 [Macroventuria anomochaeta]KAF2627502.1 hypothetical protein BU25DRAFT_48990 [Macroventuria anomochaeta]
MPTVVDGRVSRTHTYACRKYRAVCVGNAAVTEPGNFTTTPSFPIMSFKHLSVLRVLTAMTSLAPAFPITSTPRAGAVALPNVRKSFPAASKRLAAPPVTFKLDKIGAKMKRLQSRTPHGRFDPAWDGF